MIDMEYAKNNHASYYGGKDNPYECISVINGVNRITGMGSKDSHMAQSYDI